MNLQKSPEDNSSLEALTTKTALLNPGRVDTVVSTYPVVDTEITDSSMVSLLEQLEPNPEEEWENLARTTTDDNIREIAKRRADEIRLIRYLVGQKTDENDNSNEIKNLEKRIYSHYSEELYYVALRRKISQIEALNVPDNISGLREAKASILDNLYSMLPDTSASESIQSEPTPNTIVEINNWISDQFGDVFDAIDNIEEDEIDAQSIKAIFDICIHTTPVLRDTGWRCELTDRKKNAISVYAADKLIVVPAYRKNSKIALKRLVVHEVFGHALRSAIAESKGDVVGKLGTATYQSFEESFEMALGQCITGEFNQMSGVDHYVAIGMSLTSGKTRDEIGAIFKNCYQLEATAKTQSVPTTEIIEKSDQIANVQISRTFAGQTDVDEGIPHMKDIDYFHGLTGAWALLNELVKLDIVEEGMEWLLAAKFNPYNSKDRALVERIQPMPKVLADYFID